MKKVITIFLFLVVVIGCIFAAGCTETTAPAETTTPVTSDDTTIPTDVAYTVTVSKEGSATYNVGDILALTFESNPTTGYDWHLVKGEEIPCQKFNDADTQPEGLAGAPCNVTFWFQTEEEGDYPIELVYARSWDMENTTVATYSDVLHVKKSDEPIADGPKASFTFDSFNINPSAGSYVKIVTAANPTTGYYYTPSGDGLTIIEDYQVSNSALVGAPGEYNWYVTAEKPGDYTFKATYQKAGSSEELSSFTIPLKFT